VSSEASDEAAAIGDAPPSAARQAMSYGDYLRLDRILDAQATLSPDRNELLFIIQHQTSELWMKLMLHELSGAIEGLRADQLPPVFKMLARVSRIMEQLVQAWNVLATMTPSEYTALRPYLGTSSGFQSYQYRGVEFRLGNKNHAMLAPHEDNPPVLAELRALLQTPSLYDEAIAALARRGFPIDPAILHRDFSQKLEPNASVQAAWTDIYRDPQANWELYELAEELVDLEDAFRLWRFRHVTTVERIIGFKRGTGGTSGVGYLRKMLDVVLFPELWRLRTEL
jgi:tryptophan 2,3-dioxygenase